MSFYAQPTLASIVIILYINIICTHKKTRDAAPWFVQEYTLQHQYIIALLAAKIRFIAMAIILVFRTRRSASLTQRLAIILSAAITKQRRSNTVGAVSLIKREAHESIMVTRNHIIPINAAPCRAAKPYE